MQTTRHVFHLIQRIEPAQRIAHHQEQPRRFAHVGGEKQMDGAGNIRFQAEGFAIVVLGAGAGGLEQRLARIHRKVLHFAARRCAEP